MSDALVFFGATGDLAYKMIFPALQSMIRHGHLDVPIIGVAKAGWGVEQLRQRAHDSLSEHGPVDDEAFAKLVSLLDYVDGDYAEPATFDELAARLKGAQHPLHYLAIPPSLFPVVVDELARSGCAKGARIVVEKPFGRDLASAQALNKTIHAVFAEEDVFRIDHYLGKEAVQGLFVFRFANRLFEPVWNREHVRSVQITMAEKFGVAGRGSLYDSLGAIRDVVQNHLLEVLALLTMDAPDSAGHTEIREKTAALLERVKPLSANAIVRGQFRGYLDEQGVKPRSNVETFAALHLEIDSERWRGVPFLIRTGKKLPVSCTEILVELRSPPIAEFENDTGDLVRLRLSPDLEIALTTQHKKPGEAMEAEPVEMSFVQRPDGVEMTAYERLLGDAMHGDPTLFAHQRAVEAAWTIVDGVLDMKTPVIVYEPDTWGPSQAEALAEPVGGWHDPEVQP
ncbi:MAG: glucose-6-phosphate dehydrogenase [Polyangia bacterium]